MATAEKSRSVRADLGSVATDADPELRSHRDARLGALLFAAMLVAYVSTAGGSLASTDAVVTYDVTRQLVEHRTIALSADLVGNQAYRGSDGQYYSPFGILQAVWNVPFYLAGRVAYALLPGHRMGLEMMTKAAVAIGNACTAALAVWLVWRTAAAAGSSARGALGAALVAGFCTSLWPYSKFGFNVPLSAVLIVAIAYYSLEGARWGRTSAVWMAGMMCGLALLTRHEFGLAALPSVVLLGWYRRRALARTLAWWTFGAAPGACLWALYNALRYGSPIETGYLRDQTLGLGGSLVDGLWGQIASPGASVFIYSPVMIMAAFALWSIRKRDPALAWLAGGTTVIFTLFYAQLESWAGGRSYGPRYLVPFMPLACVALAVWMSHCGRKARLACFAVILISGAVQIPGVLVDFAKVRVNFAREGNVIYEARMHEWSASPLALNLGASIEAVPRVARHMLSIEPRPPVTRASDQQAREFSQQFAFSLDFWWVYLYYLGIFPALVSVAVGFSLGVTALCLLRVAWNRATSMDRAPVGARISAG